MSIDTQLDVRERIVKLLDDRSFVEIGAMVHARSTDFHLSEKDTPADGVVTGYGTIDGRLVYVYSQDRSVLSGSVGEMHAKKIVHIYDMALKMGAPVIGMIDCAGLRLQESVDGLNAFGELYVKQIAASGVIPQISLLFGRCGGGMSLVPTLSDFTLSVKSGAELFMNAPNAILGNYKEKQNTASPVFRSQMTGEIDVLAEDEEEMIAKAIELVRLLPSNNRDEAVYMDETLDDLNRKDVSLCGCRDSICILKSISDDQAFYEIKSEYAKELVTGFVSLNGYTVGAVANREEIRDVDGELQESLDPVLTVKGCLKAASFIRFCNAFSIPVLTLVNVTGYSSEYEDEMGMSTAAAKLTEAFTVSDVPKVTVITGNAYGSAYVCMGSRHIGTDFVYSWPEARIGMMNAESAVKIMYKREIDEADDKKLFIREKTQCYDSIQNSPEQAASRGYIDSIILPEETRKRVIAAFEMLLSKRKNAPDKKHTTI